MGGQVPITFGQLHLFCSLLPHVLAGVFKGVSVHISLVTLMPSTSRVLKGVNLYLFYSLFPGVFLARVLKGMSVHVSLMILMPSTSSVLKGVNLYHFLLPCMLARVLKGVSVHVHVAMVLKELGGWS